MTRLGAAGLCVALSALAATAAGAQVIPRGQAGRPRPEQQPGQQPAKPDSGKGPNVSWAPLDSVSLELLKRPGYVAVRYQANELEYEAKNGIMTLVGKKGARSAVQQEPSSLVADTIRFSQQSDSVFARGDTIVVRDAAKGENVQALGRLNYDLKNREGLATEVSSTTRSGEVWYVEAHRAAFSAADSAANRDNVFYGASGTITSCQDSTPHYHFSAREIKRISNDVVVARNVVMHIEGVPVFWLPFMFQDGRSGRRSGILTPRFGFTELVRNSPLYRRNVENVGYYFALSDYVDFAASLDWRSSANASDFDPGWTRWNGTMRYRWLNRFAGGSIGASVQSLSNGASNTQVSWNHNQDFSIHSHLTANFNFSTNTAVQRQTALAPMAALATIGSQMNYQRDMGPLNLAIGGSRRQYPGRPQVDENYPTVALSSKPITVGDWLTWTPGLNASMSDSKHLDSQGDFAKRFIARADGTIDSVKYDRGTHSSSLTLSTPLKIFDFQIAASLRAADRGNDYPELRTVVNPTDTSKKTTRVYEKTWLSELDFDLGVNLPQFFGGTLNLVPSVTMGNIGPGAFAVRSERTGSKWVTQGKRLSYGLGISPTLFALYGGIGPIARFRHSITSTLSYSYSPKADISADYLAALGQTQVGFLGNQAQNRVTLGIGTTIEAKLKAPSDTADENAGKKIKLLALTFSPVTWDFERARVSKSHSGFATDHFDVSARSDLIPGFDFGVGYSLFQGSVLSDTAVFSPYLESIRASFNLGGSSGGGAVGGLFSKLFGSPNTEAVADSTPRATSSAPGTGLTANNAGMAGQSIRGGGLDVPNVRGFEAQLSFTLSQQRPPKGGNVVQYDATLQCAPYKDINPLAYDFCVRSALQTPPVDVNALQTTAGGTFFRIPPQSNVQLRTSFNLTPKWAATWSTNYDFQRSEFGLQSVTLQREMHDWKAVFGFTQAPNGAFTFTFFVSLKAEPDLKFDYNRATYGQQGRQLPP